MSSLKQNTQDISDCLHNILLELDNIQSSIDDIDYGCIDYNDTNTVPIDKYLNRIISCSKLGKSKVEQDIDNEEIEKIESFMEDYKENKSILSLVLFLIKIYKTSAITYGSFIDLKEYIYNKLFNIKESV